MKKKTTRHIEQHSVDFLLTGKAFCGHCGASMIGDSGTSNNGTRHYYYTCQAHKARKGCHKRAVRKDLLESKVISCVMDVVLAEENIRANIDLVLAQQEEELKSSPLASMESEYAEAKRQIDNVNNAIANGIWNSSTASKLKTLEDTAENLRVSIEMLRYSQAQLMDRDRIEFFFHQFTKGDPQDPRFRQYVISTFINAVYVFDDHLDIVTNNCAGNVRLPLELLPDDPPDPPDDFCSDKLSSSVPDVYHPNIRNTIYRIAI